MSPRLLSPLFRATRSLRASGVNAGEPAPKLWKELTHRDPRPDHQKLVKGARKDPELYVLYFLTAATLAGAGLQGVKFWVPDSGEADVVQVPDSEPWKDGAAGCTGKYKFHPRGDPRSKARDAPSAMNTVIVPNVNLPRKLHETYNKWGKEEYNF